MYFDDCERRSLAEGEWEAWLPEAKRVSCADNTWQTTNTGAKIKAMKELLGHNFDSAAVLTVEQIEDETLQWALDCNVLWAGDEEDEEAVGGNDRTRGTNPKKTMTSKYSSISDLIVARECKNTIDALAFLWNLMAKLLNNQELNTVYMVVFPNAPTMWNYEIMVTALQALTISTPLLPSRMQHLQLDLFHPNYKYSPRMWSPEMHSPFPTLALSIKDQPSSISRTTNTGELTLDEDLDATRSRLEALFVSVDADDRVTTRLLQDNKDTKEILVDCQRWAQRLKCFENGPDIEWLVDSHIEPFHLYASIWAAIGGMQAGGDDEETKCVSSIILVAPNVDAHTTERLAITVNAALRRLHSPIRVVNVFHPSSLSESRRAPCAMIQLMDEPTLDAGSR